MVCDLIVPGVFFVAVVTFAAGEVENDLDVRVEAFTKLRTAVRAGCVRSIVRLLLGARVDQRRNRGHGKKRLQDFNALKQEIKNPDRTILVPLRRRR